MVWPSLNLADNASPDDRTKQLKVILAGQIACARSTGTRALSVMGSRLVRDEEPPELARSTAEPGHIWI